MGNRHMDHEQRGDDPLFFLSAAGCAPISRSREMRGKFAQNGEQHVFIRETGPDVPDCRLRCVQRGRADRRYRPLVAFLAKEELPVVLSGDWTGRDCDFAVRDIHAEPEKDRFPLRKHYSDEFLGVVINRLRTTRSCGAEPGEKEAEPRLRRIEEIEAYCRICGHTFQPWLARAIRGELEKATASDSSDQRKHSMTALGYLINIDWSKKALRVPDAKTARKILDEEFCGLEAVKTRILEIIAQIRRTGELPRWGILLSGPPGTGKTSIAKAFARLLNEPVIPLDISSLGSDPEGVSGSSRIYSNARPGLILDKLRIAGSATGVLLINEVDKATEQGRDGKRGSSDVLLTLLDGQGFYDNFMETSVPTDGLFAVATCNELSKISAPLKNRFYVIEIPGYTSEEKKVILSDYVLPRAMRPLKLRPGQMSFTEEAAETLVREYAVEPGARDLEQYAERFTGVFCRRMSERGEEYSHAFTKDEVRGLLGSPKRVRRSFALNPGEINTAYYYDGAARILLMEAAVTRGSGQFKVFGPVPEAQKEYIQIAYECMKNTMSIDLSDKDVAVFIPHTVPPSLDNHLGCAAYAAICSQILNVRLELRSIAFVGGVDLNGNLYFDDADVLPLMRALREAGIDTIYAPLGVGEMIRSHADETCSVTVMEAQDARSLLSLAMAASRV